MIETLQDRMAVISRKSPLITAAEAGVESVVTTQLLSVQGQTGELVHLFREVKTGDPTQSLRDRISTLLRGILDSALIVMHLLQIEPPAEDVIEDMLDDFSPEIQLDGILASCVVSRGATDSLLTYYDDGCEVSEDMTMMLCEILCGVFLLGERIDLEMQDLICGEL